MSVSVRPSGIQIGAVLPQTEIGSDVGAIRAYAEGVAGLGYAHVVVYDHVLGADPAVHAGWDGPYDVRSTFHEPFVLFGFLAALTDLELVTGVLVLPQRQTALVAKQAAEVDLLTRGRFRLGVGIGWNAVEYEALGRDFRNRGARVEGQIDLLRRLWTTESVSYVGLAEQISGAGIAPLPVQRPIPVWIGASSPPALRRAGRIADGWFPTTLGRRFESAKETVDEAALAAGRDPASIGMEGRASLAVGGAEQLARDVVTWRDVGATHCSVNTMRAGLGGADGHLAVLAEVADALGLRAR